MSKAAAHLNLSQSAVSKAFGELEHTLVVRLLDRTPQGIKPTIYGTALLSRATAIFDEVRQGVKDIEFLADPTVGEVRVGCNEPIAAGLLAAIIERLGRQYPRVVCHMMQTPTVATLEYRELRDRHVDLILARIKEPFADEELHADILFHDRLTSWRESKANGLLVERSGLPISSMRLGCTAAGGVLCPDRSWRKLFMRVVYGCARKRGIVVLQSVQ
jgi:DNA-binding transcriptional LysR family regulator